VNPAPLRIEPIFSPRIWGARSLAPLFPEKSNLSEPLGEAWLTGLDCRIACEPFAGPFAGKTLGETWREMPSEWRGKQFTLGSVFPLLVKFLFPTEKLSIQVHPNDAYAAIHEIAAGGRGKTEMWHIVSAEPDARVLIGLKPGVGKQQFLEGLEKHTLESLFRQQNVHAGDTFFVPAGTPHTIGPGMVICEVQETSDLTYRVYDYGRVDSSGRQRELHIDKALQVTNFGGPITGGKVAPLPLPDRRVKKNLLAACPFFATERWEFSSTAQLTPALSHFELFAVLEGSGRLAWENSSAPYSRGECWFVPASLGQCRIEAEGETTLIRTYVPNIAQLRSEIREMNFSETQLAGVVFA
jgi:mannose-6-phosphate isomerase